MQHSKTRSRLKEQLTLQIDAILKDNGMTQVEIAKILGV
jgi:predicted XRE-type DNA-binding protein